MTANRRAGNVYVKGELAGIVWQDDEGYGFQYNENYIERAGAAPVSLTLPFTTTPHLSRAMLPFFDGLIPEGWLLNITVKNWKLDPRDRMGLLLTACKDCIGAVSVEPILTND
jgi:serine/threonine-protein kinase HipA